MSEKILAALRQLDPANRSFEAFDDILCINGESSCGHDFPSASG
jgi:hypothetical protein